MPAHELRDAFAQAAGPDVTVQAARLKYAPMNHQIIEVDGIFRGERFALMSDSIEPSANPLDHARKMGVQFRSEHEGKPPDMIETVAKGSV